MTDTNTGASSGASQGVPGWTWPNYIGWGAMINQARMEADWKGLWDYAIPHLHATEENVARTEAQLGFRLPESYRGFRACQVVCVCGVGYRWGLIRSG